MYGRDFRWNNGDDYSNDSSFVSFHSFNDAQFSSNYDSMLLLVKNSRGKKIYNDCLLI